MWILSLSCSWREPRFRQHLEIKDICPSPSVLLSVDPGWWDPCLKHPRLPPAASYSRLTLLTPSLVLKPLIPPRFLPCELHLQAVSAREITSLVEGRTSTMKETLPAGVYIPTGCLLALRNLWQVGSRPCKVMAVEWRVWRGETMKVFKQRRVDQSKICP